MRLGPMMLLCGLVMMGGRPRIAGADEEAPPEPEQRARQLLVAERALEAVKLLEEAYGQRQQPRLLCLLGEAHELLGDAKKAYFYYQKCLVAVADTALRAQTMARLNRLRPLLPPEPATPAVSVTRPPLAVMPLRYEQRKHHGGMIKAGITLLSIGYGVAFVTALGLGIPADATTYNYDGKRSSYNQAAAGAFTLLIPVAGPVVSAGVWKDAILPWGLPWLLCGLPFQAVGLGLILQGYRTPQRVLVEQEEARLPPVQVLPYATAEGAGLAAFGRF